MLAVAASLTPDPKGRGTHRQLGLPPCTMLVLFGRPCPSCGMTTAWAWLVRGQLRESLQANAGGTLLAALAVAGAPWLLLSALRGRWIGTRPNGTTLTWIAAVVLLVTMIQWGWRWMNG